MGLLARGAVIGGCLVLGACASGETSTSTTTSSAPAPVTTTTVEAFPASPSSSEEALRGMTGFFSAFVIRPAQAGLDPRSIAMDAGPLLRQVDPDRLRADVEAVAVPRSAGDAGLVSVEEHVFSRLADAGLFVYDDRVADDLGPNLVAGVGGTVCPERTAVVVAHYDALVGSPGADDNATGVAALLEAARIVLEHRLPMSVGFVLVDDGTGDRAGSRLLVERLEEQRLIPVGAISLDGIGVTSSSVDEQLKVDGQFLLMAADEQSEYLARVFAVSVDRFLPDFWAWSAEVPLDRYGEFAESDHQPFWEAGHQALWFTDANFWRSDIAGTEADTPDTIDYDFLANGTRALLAGLVGLGSIDFDDDGVPDVCTREL